MRVPSSSGPLQTPNCFRVRSSCHDCCWLQFHVLKYQQFMQMFVCSGLKTLFSDIPSSQVGIVGERPRVLPGLYLPLCVPWGAPIPALPVVNTFTLTSWSVQLWSFFRKTRDTPFRLVEGNHYKLRYILTRFCGKFPSQRFDLSAS